jgi:hypothetical protein
VWLSRMLEDQPRYASSVSIDMLGAITQSVLQRRSALRGHAPAARAYPFRKTYSQPKNRCYLTMAIGTPLG